MPAEPTIDTAQVERLWPDPADRPSAREIAEIRRAAKSLDKQKIPDGYLPQAPWAVRAIYFVQEQRAARLEREKEEERRERLRPRAAAAPQQQPVPQGGCHPTAERWAKWPAPPDLTDCTAAYREFTEGWHKKNSSSPLPVYRPELDDHAVASIADCRKLYRSLIVQADEIAMSLLFLHKELVASVQRKVDEHAARIAELEKRKIPEYRGIWQEDAHYPQGSMVTRDGSVWFARRDTVEKPGDSRDWQLAVKRGRDGRHGKDAP